MGGHGGLNILPQKRWNVYRYDNREKVRKDEEAAAREEQLSREQSNRRDAEIRLDRLRHARGGAPSSSSTPTLSTPAPADPSPSPPPSPDSGHINLFHGLKGFSSLIPAADHKKSKREASGEDGSGRDKKRKKEEPPRTVGPEDEKYRMGYGVAGKGVKVPWYLAPSAMSQERDESEARHRKYDSGGGSVTKGGSGKKTIEELREERVKRERKEKEREQALFARTAAAARQGSSREHCRLGDLNH